MSKILLINPDPVSRVLPPLGISYIAENLKKHNHLPVILDMGFDNPDKNNQGWEKIIEDIDFVGITATTLIYFNAKDIVKKIKKIRPGLPVILGGIHPSILPQFVLDDSGCDAVVVGEGEEVMVDIANRKMQPKGIINAPVINEIDTIPFLTYEYLDIQKYFKFGGTDRIRWSLPQPCVSIIGTRGCPYACTFCASKTLFGRKVRFRSVENIMLEIDFLRKKYGIKAIYFCDDTLTLKKSWLKQLCDELAKRKMQWICGTRVDVVDEKILQMMKFSGCKYISYGIESGSNKVLNDIIKKETTIEQAERILKLTRKVGIGIIANYMFGLPGETEEDMKLTLKAIKKIPADTAEFSVYIPLPGAELATDLDWTVYKSNKNPYHSTSYIHTPEFSRIIKRYHRKAVRNFYFSPKYLFERLKMLLYPQRVYYALKSLFKLIQDLMK
ncbi:MAG: radical SAM protein [Bacteroidales bacterium]|nr:radical SAM protein [Bacteroidales bacterium]